MLLCKQKSKKLHTFRCGAHGPVRSCVDLVKTWRDTSSCLAPGFCFPLLCGVQEAGSRTVLLGGPLRRGLELSHFHRADAKAESQP